MTNQEIVDYVFNTPENVNSNVLKDIIAELNDSAKQEILNYVLKTPENFNPNILKDILDSWDVYYSVYISLTNPKDENYFESCKIFELNSNNPDDIGNEIGEITSPTGNTTVLVNSKIYGIIVIPEGDGVLFYVHPTDVTGGVILITGDVLGTNKALYQITGDGTINIDKIDYWF